MIIAYLRSSSIASDRTFPPVSTTFLYLPNFLQRDSPVSSRLSTRNHVVEAVPDPGAVIFRIRRRIDLFVRGGVSPRPTTSQQRPPPALVPARFAGNKHRSRGFAKTRLGATRVVLPSL